MRSIKCLLMILLSVAFSYGQQNLTREHKEAITEFIQYFKANDRQKIAQYVSYPFKRHYPLPDIKSKSEFLERYDEVFDAKLSAMIAGSSISDEDHWSAVGYRGVMFGNGRLWLEHDGTLLAVNYETEMSKRKREALIALEKKNIHSSLSVFIDPICILTTKKFIIRIDEISEGRYRYASWKADAKMTDKPDLVLMNGEYFPDGSGGNHYYKFTNGKYTYQCGIIVLGEDDASPAYLIVYKDGTQILHQPADMIKS